MPLEHYNEEETRQIIKSTDPRRNLVTYPFKKIINV